MTNWINKKGIKLIQLTKVYNLHKIGSQNKIAYFF